MNPACNIGTAALIPNPALQPLAFLIGEWDTIGSHPMRPGKPLHGAASFAWHEGGAFLVMRQQVDEPGFPHGVAIFGSDGGGGRDADDLVMLYFDQRQVSRIHRVQVGELSVTWRRDAADLSQTFTITAQDDGTLVGSGRMSKDGGPWGDDLSQRFVRRAP